MHTVHIHRLRHPRKSSHLFSSSFKLVRFPNPLASGHSWQLGNLTTFKSTFLIANEKKMYLSASSCCSCPCTQVLRLMYSGLRWRSLERKLRSCLREGRGAEVWGGGGSGARGARGQAAAQKGGGSSLFLKEIVRLSPEGFYDHGSPRWDGRRDILIKICDLTYMYNCTCSSRVSHWNLAT